MDGRVDIQWCDVDSDGQTGRKCVDGGKVITEGGERGSERESCQSPVRRAARLKNVCNIPLLL